MKQILLVEDNEGDIMLITEALVEADSRLNLSVARDGVEALDFMIKKAGSFKKGLPDLILLDINLPKINGQEVLQFIKKSKLFKHIPVVMLTTSSAERDINLSYENSANCFIIKPVEADEFESVVSAIQNFWLSTVRLPSLKN